MATREGGVLPVETVVASGGEGRPESICEAVQGIEVELRRLWTEYDVVVRDWASVGLYARRSGQPLPHSPPDLSPLGQAHLVDSIDAATPPERLALVMTMLRAGPALSGRMLSLG